jgi:cytochrome c oxidase subunit 3
MAFHSEPHTDEHHEEHTHHWEVSWAPMAVSFGVLFLVPLPFAFFAVYSMPVAAIISAGLGTPLVIAGIAKWISEGAHESDQVHLPGSGLSSIGLAAFISGEILIFLGLFAAYWTMRLTTATDNWPPAGTPEFDLVLPLIMTVILVTSSLTYHRAEHHYEHDNMGAFRVWLIVSIIIGAAFVGCTFYEYAHLTAHHFVPSTNQYSSAFYSLTGFHASHVLVGLASFVAILIAASYGRAHKALVKTAGIYWHFVDVVWFFVASQVYYW